MSAKFKRAQKHKKWSETGTSWPQEYLDQVSALRSNAGASPLLRGVAEELARLTGIHHTFGEVEGLRKVLAAWAKLAAAEAAATAAGQQRAEGPDPGTAAHAGSGSSSSSGGPFAPSCALLVELLFLDNSKPLHRSLLAQAKKLPQHQLDAFGEAVTRRMLLALDRLEQQQQQDAAAGATAPRVALATASGSLLWLPAAHAWLRPCVARLVRALGRGVGGVLAAADRGALHVAPALMEEVQDAVGALYYLLQRHGRFICEEEEEGGGGCGREAVVAAGSAMLRALQGRALVREALASAAVVLWAAATLPAVRPGDAAAAFGQGLFYPPRSQASPPGAPAATGSSGGSSVRLVPEHRLRRAAAAAADEEGVVPEQQQQLEEEETPPLGLLDEWLRSRGAGSGGLVLELGRLSPIGHICALKGLVTAMPLEATCARIRILGSSAAGDDISSLDPAAGSASDAFSDAFPDLKSGLPGRPWHFLVDGVLSHGCRAVRDAPDAHFKFHAACVLNFAMGRVLATWQAAADRAASDPGSGGGLGSGEQAGGAAAGSVFGPAAAAAGGGGGVALRAALLRGPQREMMMSLLWANLEEPLAQTVKQVQEAFALLLEALEVQEQQQQQQQAQAHAQQQQEQDGCAAQQYEAFKQQVCARLLALAPGRKGRYAPLGCMAERGCALALLRHHPALVSEALQATADDMVSNSAAAFLKALLAAARTEAGQDPQAAQAAAEAVAAACGAAGAAVPAECGGGGGVYSVWCGLWQRPLLQALYGPSDKVRSYVAVHGLPAVLSLEPGAALDLVRAILQDAGSRSGGGGDGDGGRGAAGPGGRAAAPEPLPGTSRVAALVSVLKAARVMGLVGDLDALVAARERLAMDPEQVLLSAACHASEAVRLDVLELACVSTRLSEAPGSLELALVEAWLGLSLRSTVMGSRNKCLVLLTKLLARIRAAVAAIRHRQVSPLGPPHPSNRTGRGAQLLFSLGRTEHEDAVASGDAVQAGTQDADGAPERGAAALERMQSFLLRLTRLLVAGLYPGAPYERRFFSLELLNAVLEAWGPNGQQHQQQHAAAAGAAGGSGAGRTAQHPSSSSCGATQPQPPGGGAVKGMALARTGPAEGIAASMAPKGYNAPPGAHGRRPAGGRAAGGAGGLATAALAPFQPYCPELLTPNTVALLLAGAVDSWDRMRQAASGALMRLPTPLPGLSSPPSLGPLLRWSVGLLWSPRMRESDAGARLIKLLYCKYVLQLHWRLLLQPEPAALPPLEAATAAAGAAPPLEPLHAAVLGFLDSVLALAAGQLAVAQGGDLLAACRRSLVHGPLLLLRYAVEDVDWPAVAASPAAAQEAAAWAARALALAQQVAAVALPVLSRPQESNVGAEEVDAEGDVLGDGDDDGDDGGAEGDGDSSGLGPEAQIIATALWSSVKEVSLLLATLVRHMPLPGGGSSGAEEEAEEEGEEADGGAAAAAAGAGSEGALKARLQLHLLQPEQLQAMGALLLQLLFDMKHNGAVEKTSLALMVVADRLLRCPLQRLNALPAQWLAAALTRAAAPGQGRDDIVRRSSGLPFAFVALFLAEPANTPKALLPRGMRALLALAEEAHLVASGRDSWPVVHAFNSLRHAFQDSHLAVDTSGYFADGIQACLRALSCSAWEVRNAATLCFTALTTRVLGFKNDSKSELCKKTVSGVEFFQRYPALHRFLLAQLSEAAQQLADAPSPASGPHPGLYPVLIILSRLSASNLRSSSDTPLAPAALAPAARSGDGANPCATPSAAAGNGANGPPDVCADTNTTTAPAAPTTATFMGGLSPAAFTPLVRTCAGAQALTVRRLAARALVPLVAPEDVPMVVTQLLAALPCAPRQASASGDAAAAASGAVRLNANALQGALLQAAALMEAAAEAVVAVPLPTAPSAAAAEGSGGACGAATSPQQRLHAAIAAAALPALERGSWLVDPSSSSPSAARSAHSWALLQAAAPALELLPTELISEHGSAVSELANVCRAAVALRPPAGAGGVTAATDFPDPMRSQMQKLAARLWLGPVLQCQSFRSSSPAGFFLEGLLRQATTCLLSSSYEVRAAALQAVVHLLRALLDAPQAPTPPEPPAARPGQGEGGDAPGRVAAGAGAGSSGALVPARQAKLVALAAQLAGKRPLMERLVSEGMALMWRAVAGERNHKVVRRLLRALGLMHAMARRAGCAAVASGHAGGAPAAIASARQPQPQRQQLFSSWAALQLGGGAAAVGAPHAPGCECCQPAAEAATPEGLMAAARAAAQQAAAHVALVEGMQASCRDLESRCEAIKCLARALASAVLAQQQRHALEAAVAAAAAAADAAPGAAAAAAGADGTVAPSLSAPHSLLPAYAAFVDQVAAALAPWQPDDWRRAAAEALAASQLLQTAASALRATLLLHAAGSGSADTGAADAADVAPAASVRGAGAGAGAQLVALSLRGWRCVLTMLEDEDMDVRREAARLSQETMALAPLGGQGALSPSKAAHGSPGVFAQQPLFVEAAMRLLFRWLAVAYGSSCYSLLPLPRCEAARAASAGDGNSACSGAGEEAVEVASAAWSGVAALLCERVLAAGQELPEVILQARAENAAGTATAGASGAAARGAVVLDPLGGVCCASLGEARSGRLFEREADNAHEEPLLLAQLAADTLRSGLLLQPQPSGAGGGAARALPHEQAQQLRAWCEAAAASLHAAAEYAGAAPAGEVVQEGQLGCAANHQDLFALAYRALLALWAAAPVRQQLLAPQCTSGQGSGKGSSGAEGGKGEGEEPLGAALGRALQQLAAGQGVAASQLGPALRAVMAEWAPGAVTEGAEGSAGDSGVGEGEGGQHGVLLLLRGGASDDMHAGLV